MKHRYIFFYNGYIIKSTFSITKFGLYKPHKQTLLILKAFYQKSKTEVINYLPQKNKK